MQVAYCYITVCNWTDYLHLCDRQLLGPLLLPRSYSDNMWGHLIYIDNQIAGGWVGSLRANRIPFSYLAKSVWFDCAPWFVDKVTEEQRDEFLRYIIWEAAKDHIVLLNMTHWIRNELPSVVEKTERAATFLIPLNRTVDELWADVESKQRNIIRKGEKNDIIILQVTKEDAINFLIDFQHLREKTQARAIHRNAKSSMLLKSDAFFRNVLMNMRSRLFVAKRGEDVAAMALILEGGKTAYYYSGGSDYEINKKTGASAYLLWNAITYYAEKNFAYFDMGGVPVSPEKTHPAFGVYTFKKSFGGEYMEFDQGKIVVNQWKYKILNFLLQQRKLLRFVSKVE